MNHIEIMRSDPTLVCNGKTIEVKGRQRELFRLLILYEGRTVSNDIIAQLRETEIDTARSKIRYLRDQLSTIGCENLIQTNRSSGYRALLDGWHVDTQEFRDTVEPLNGTFDVQLGHTINVDAARDDVRKLKRALSLWHENPATNLPIGTGFEGEFEDLKNKAETLLLIAQLGSQQPGEIHEAIRKLEHRNRHAPDYVTWKLLLLGYDAIGMNSQVGGTWQKIVACYKAGTPDELRLLMRAIGDKNVKNPFRVTGALIDGASQEIAGEYTSNDAPLLQSLCSMLGITTASQLRLANSQLTPLACIRRTQTRLYFSGVLASKWVIEPAIRSEFSQLLARLDANNGDARFLMINPKGDGFRRLTILRQGNISLESVSPLKQLAEKHRSLQVRLYNNLPAFRIVVIDDDVVSISPYRLAADAYLTSDRGWEAPHLVLDPMAKYPLAEAFLLLFAETWENAIPIGDVL